VSSFALGQPHGFGRSFQRTRRGLNPAAGSSYVVSLDSNYRHVLVHAVFTLTTAATVANRYTTVQYTYGDGVPAWVNAAAVVQTASSAQRYVGSKDRGTSEWNAGTDVLFPIAPMYLDGGGTFSINVASMAGADQLSAIYLTFDLYPTSDSVMPDYGSQEGWSSAPDSDG
jgi:hypothetical protein